MLEKCNSYSRKYSTIKKPIYVLILIKFMKYFFLAVSINLFDSVWYAFKCQQGSTIALANKNINIYCHSAQTYEGLHQTYYMLVCLIQFSVFENINSGSQNILGTKKAIKFSIMIKLLKCLTRIFASKFVLFRIVRLKKSTGVNHRFLEE